jgi:ketosteroid isomerase-like protein
VAELVRWEITEAAAGPRGLDDRLRLAVPSFSRRMARRVMGMPAGSRVRTAALTRSVRAYFAANNRDDYEVMLAGVHPDVEVIPPGRGRSGLGFAEVYRGPDGMRKFIEQWKAGFSEFRYEPREIADPGGSRFAVRIGMIGRFAGSGGEVRDEYGGVSTIEDGLLRRSEAFYDWEEALRALG